MNPLNYTLLGWITGFICAVCIGYLLKRRRKAYDVAKTNFNTQKEISTYCERDALTGKWTALWHNPVTNLSMRTEADSEAALHKKVIDEFIAALPK